MSSATCKNCEHPLSPTDQFCAHCGQTAQVHRLDLPHILHEVVHVLTHADKGILYLTREMAVRPGLVAKDYVNGRRKRYFNPFSYLVLTIAVSAFLTSYFHLMEIDTQHVNRGTALVSKHINLIFLLGAPVSAFFSWLLFRRSGYNFAENLVLHAFLGGFRVVFFMLIFTPLVVFFRHQYFSMLGIYMGLWAIFHCWANWQFYGGRLWLVIVKTLLSMLLTQMVITTLLIVAMRFLF